MAEKEIWVKGYSSSHHILLVGEGDFSFALCLAQSFGSASNIVATSLDSYEDVIKKYKEGKSNLEKLKKLGAALLHKVDATKMKVHTDLNGQKFDWIIFNFPHAGFHRRECDHYMIGRHRRLMGGFFRNAKDILRSYGAIHVNHKTGDLYSHWNLEELADLACLKLDGRGEFKKDDYPGYNNKRGDGPDCDEPFRLGECRTFTFIHNGRKETLGMMDRGAYDRRGETSTQIQGITFQYSHDMVGCKRKRENLTQVQEIPHCNPHLRRETLSVRELVNKYGSGGPLAKIQETPLQWLHNPHHTIIYPRTDSIFNKQEIPHRICGPLKQFNGSRIDLMDGLRCRQIGDDQFKDQSSRITESSNLRVNTRVLETDVGRADRFPAYEFRGGLFFRKG